MYANEISFIVTNRRPCPTSLVVMNSVHMSATMMRSRRISNNLQSSSVVKLKAITNGKLKNDIMQKMFVNIFQIYLFLESLSMIYHFLFSDGQQRSPQSSSLSKSGFCLFFDICLSEENFDIINSRNLSFFQFNIALHSVSKQRLSLMSSRSNYSSSSESSSCWPFFFEQHLAQYSLTLPKKFFYIFSCRALFLRTSTSVTVSLSCI